MCYQMKLARAVRARPGLLQGQRPSEWVDRFFKRAMLKRSHSTVLEPGTAVSRGHDRRHVLVQTNVLKKVRAT